MQRMRCSGQRDTARNRSARNNQQIPVFMANPPSSAISNWNPPRKTGTYNDRADNDHDMSAFCISAANTVA
jgi:hypothetical protein